METSINTKLNNKLLQLLNCFINDLMVAFPEKKNEILNISENILNIEQITNIEDHEIVKVFLNDIYKNHSKITKKEDKLFENFILFNKINMKELWNVATPQNKEVIWKYLQSFAIISIHFNSSKTVKELIDGTGDEINKEEKKDLKDVKNLNELSKSIKSKKKESSTETNNMMEGMSKMLEGTDIGKLAMDIANEINVDELKEGIDENETNPMNILQSGNFMDMFKKINESVTQKITNGEINPENMMGQMANILPMMNENPFFNNIINSDEVKNIVKNTGNKESK
tara:strand:- start:2675 stop:3529 length:855 start_codon:yes stop_codon:yes gene_type:complete